MHDIRFIRDDAKSFDEAMARRGLEPQSDAILAVDQKRRQIITTLQELQQKRNETSRQIGDIKKAGGDADAIMAEVAAIKSEMTALEEREKALGEDLDAMLLSLPNILDAGVPDGADESDNVELRKIGEATSFSFPAQDHVALGESLGMMDFAAGAKLSGSRFVVLKSGLARLERALAAFMLDTHCGEFGYQEILPPALVKSETMQGTGQLPKFAEDLFHTEDDRWLIPTAEVPLTNLVANEILDADDLPLRLTAYTPCFRAEAGAAGRDTRGMIRQHQLVR